ncbi:MAG: hypothetical protein K9L56_14445 [Clostridiales bacterium]|nr:hypothetical protein [Clostridiales bacterium]
MWMGNKSTVGKVVGFYLSKSDGNLRIREIEFKKNLDTDFIKKNKEYVKLEGNDIKVTNPEQFSERIVRSGKSEVKKDETLEGSFESALKAIEGMTKKAKKRGWKNAS